MKKLIRRHPTTSYVVLALAISWGGILAVIRGGPIPASSDEATRLFAPVYLAMLLGPSLAAFVVMAVDGGRQQLATFRQRLFAWRVPIRWYAAALLIAPVTLLVSFLLTSPWLNGAQLAVASGGGAGPFSDSGRASFLWMGLLVGMGAGFFEEIGWTGTALPRVRRKLSIASSGIVIGVVWGVWHFVAILWGSANAFGTVPIPVYMIVALFSFLLPYRVLMVWVYEHTRSLFVSIIMHTSLTTSTLVLGPAVSGVQLVVFNLGFGALLWVVVAAARTHSGVRFARMAT